MSAQKQHLHPQRLNAIQFANIQPLWTNNLLYTHNKNASKVWISYWKFEPAYTSLLHKFAPYYKFSIEPRAHIGQHGKHTGLPTRHLTCHRFRLCWLMWQHDSFDITWNWMINTQLWYAVSAMSFTPAWHLTHQHIQLTSNWFQKPQLTRQCQHPTYSQSIWGTVRAP